MANTEELDRNVLDALSSGPAGSSDYLRQKTRALDRFKSHLSRVEKTDLDTVILNDEELEKCLKSYFFGIRVPEVIPDEAHPGKSKKTGGLVLPKLGYAKNVKSVLFNVLTKDYKVKFVPK